MDYAKESLRLHQAWKGKIQVNATVPVATREDLSLAYTPGVAQPCLEIQDVYKRQLVSGWWPSIPSMTCICGKIAAPGPSWRPAAPTRTCAMSAMATVCSPAVLV